MFSIGLSEIVLPVKDVKSAARFYQEVVGLIPDAAVSSWKGAHEEWAWFWAGEPGKRQRVALLKSSHANERFVIEGVSDFPNERRWGQIHFAFEIPRDRIDDAVRHVRSAGVVVEGPVRLEWMKAIAHYFYDLDGNLLEWWSPDP